MSGALRNFSCTGGSGMRRTRHALAVCSATIAAALAVAGGVPAASGGATPKAHAANAAATIAVEFAKAGAPYLVDKLKAGEAGSTGESIGNFIGPFVASGEGAKLDQIRAEIAGLKLGIDDARAKLNSIAAHVTQSQYSTAALHASTVLGAIDKAQKELNNLALAPTENDRIVHADNLFAQLGPHGNLHSAQETLHKQLTTPATGADGILIAANKAAKERSNPFFTRSLAVTQREVFKYYSMYQSVLLTLRVNYWHHRKLDHTTIERELHAFDRELSAQRDLLKPEPWPQTAVDTRTNLLWANSLNGSHQITYAWNASNSFATHARYLASLKRWIVSCSSCPYAPGGIWSVPTIAELQTLALDHGPPALTGWLFNAAGFAPFAVPPQWAQPPPGSNTPLVYDINTGGVGSIPTTQHAGFIGVSHAAVEVPGYFYY